MAHYKTYRGDPYWTTARFASECPGCHQRIGKGARIFYYPNGKHAYCAQCGRTESAKFSAAAADEEHNRSL